MASRALTHADLQAAGLRTDSTRNLMGARVRKPEATFAVGVYTDELEEASGRAVFASGEYIVPRRFFGIVEGAGVSAAFEVEAERGRFLSRQLVYRADSPVDLDEELSALLRDMVRVISAFVAIKHRQTRTGLKTEFAVLDRGAQGGAHGWWDAYFAEAKPHKPQRGRRLEAEHFEKVADAYRVAVQAGIPPTQAIADTFQVPYSTAGRWVMKTRRRGFLAPAPAPGQPGERGVSDG